VGVYLGGLSTLKAPVLGGIAIREAVKRAGVEGISGGIPATVPALTVNKVCGSGLKSVMLAAQAVKAGDAKCIVAGGMESMSNAPHYTYGMRDGIKYGDQKLVDGLQFDGLWCSFGNNVMGTHAEYTAEKAGITREQQDEFACNSQQKTAAAMEAGKFKDEIVPVEVPGRKGKVTVVDTDEGPKAGTTIEGLAKLRPAFAKEGTVTAGNASTINDGASAVVVTSQAFAEERGLDILARITGYTTGNVEPQDIFFAPIFAVQNLMKQLDVSLDYFDLIESNEAFAVQALANGNELGWDWDRVNVNGGAIAIGHPIGASGARVFTTLLYAMKDRGAKTGLATLCLGGGGAVVLSVECV
jgi:acetyl-CoA C-acetyltransferase